MGDDTSSSNATTKTISSKEQARREAARARMKAYWAKAKGTNDGDTKPKEAPPSVAPAKQESPSPSVGEKPQVPQPARSPKPIPPGEVSSKQDVGSTAKPARKGRKQADAAKKSDAKVPEPPKRKWRVGLFGG
jgi:hypothetical protein